MTINVGTTDRILRAALGAVLLFLAFFSGLPAFDAGVLKYGAAKYGAAIVGVVMLVVAAVRMCPIYSIFGIKTCRV